MSAENSIVLDLSSELIDEKSVQIGVTALKDSASVRGWSVGDAGSNSGGQTVEISLADGSTTDRRAPGVLPSIEEQSYTLRVGNRGPSATVTIVAGGVLGAAYGVIWLADRIRTQAPGVEGWLPADEDRTPAFEQRMGLVNPRFVRTEGPPYIDVERSRQGIVGATKDMENALLAGASIVLGHGTQFLVPWGDNAYGQRAEMCRELFLEFLEEIHARRLVYYSMDDEFLYLPEWLEEQGATLSVDDPKFYEALKVKYRGVMDTIPELDGIATRIGEIIPQGDILSWHVIHTPDDRSLEGNYRRFVKAVHEVVVGEFDKQYLHRTWTVNTWEQSSVPEIYARTFTDDIPTKNFYLAIKGTTGDQWEWQPINPTYGQTPHATVAHIETGRAQNYLSGSPDWAVEFAQAVFETAIEHGATASWVNQRDSWEKNLWQGMEYVTSRLAWDLYQPVRDVVRDWASAQVGHEIADRMADLLLDLDDIHREGFHIHGPAYHTWEPFRHARRGWNCKGNPYIDGGYGQHRRLRDIYLMAKPELESGLRMMSTHTQRYDEWLESYRGWLTELPDPEQGRWLETILVEGQDNLHINLAYVLAFLRYFDYTDNPDQEHQQIAKDAIVALLPELERFKSVSTETVQGIEVFLEFAERGLNDLKTTEADMARRLDDDGVTKLLQEARDSDGAAIDAASDASQVFRWRGAVDGRSILHIDVAQGTVTIQHLLGDSAQQTEFLHSDMPQSSGRFCARLTQSQERGWSYILEQPSDANNNTLSVLMDDNLPGFAPYDVGLYWVSE